MRVGSPVPAKKECNYCTQGSSWLVRDTTATGTSCSLLRSLALERRRGLSLVVVWTPCSLFGCVAARAFSGPAAQSLPCGPRPVSREPYGSWGRRRPRVGPRPRRARACARSLSLFLSSLAFLPRRRPSVTTPSRLELEPRYRGPGPRRRPYRLRLPRGLRGRGSGYEGYPGSALLKIAKSGLAARTYAPAAVQPQAQRRAAAIDRAAARAAPWTSATRAATLRVA